MKLIVIRHAQTRWNEIGKIQGFSNQPLSKKGKRQAALLGKRFQKGKIDAIYTSKLKRAISTATAIAKYHPHILLRKCKELNEMNWGSWEAHTIEEINKKFPDEYEARLADKFNFAPRGGESTAHLKKRLTPFLTKLLKKHAHDTVLIVGHGGTNRTILGIILGWNNKRTAHTFTKNTGVSILHVKKGKSRLHLFNCTRHLETTLSKKKSF